MSVRSAWSGILLTAVFVVGVFVGSLGLTGAAQTQPTATSAEYVMINFMKVPAGGAPAYIELERNTMRPIMQERIKRGTIRRWAAYQVLWPRGDEREYDFVTMDVHPTYADTAPATPERQKIQQEILAKVHGNLTQADLQKRVNAARTIVRGQMLQLVAEAR
jgi:hypothetical protein